MVCRIGLKFPPSKTTYRNEDSIEEDMINNFVYKIHCSCDRVNSRVELALKTLFFNQSKRRISWKPYWSGMVTTPPKKASLLQKTHKQHYRSVAVTLYSKWSEKNSFFSLSLIVWPSSKKKAGKLKDTMKSGMCGEVFNPIVMKSE